MWIKTELQSQGSRRIDWYGFTWPLKPWWIPSPCYNWWSCLCPWPWSNKGLCQWQWLIIPLRTMWLSLVWNAIWNNMWYPMAVWTWPHHSLAVTLMRAKHILCWLQHLGNTMLYLTGYQSGSGLDCNGTMEQTEGVRAGVLAPLWCYMQHAGERDPDLNWSVNYICSW